MSKRDKLRRKLRNNPKGARFSEIETLLLRFGFSLVRVKGSHHFFEYQAGEIKLVVVLPVHNNQIKVQYVKDIIELLDEFFPESTGEDSDEVDNDPENA